jgi:signal transduction histidine kinase
LTLEISDTGLGLPTDDIQLLLQPFYSTKGRGSGMGLALVHRIVTEHGGQLDLTVPPEGGTTARMYFPGAVIQTPQGGGTEPEDSPPE